ncbi:histone-lysine N-methyltransferase SETD7 isoform X2 [Salminus brasiliensis]|uniref:histone-lysine N-methyltransferase SETD7 isoform X2 n=1 Tax=Salminus brasiliensis TaxID=930266 RepID=UPI003B82FC29
MDSDDDNVEEVVEGPLDDDELPHGFCTVTYSSSDRFEGHFVHGEKNGKGKFFFFDGSTLEGFYVDDALQGQGVYTYEDGGALHGAYVDGELNGPAQEFDPEGRLIFKGQYKDNIRCGLCWVYYPWVISYGLTQSEPMMIPLLCRTEAAWWEKSMKTGR